MPRNQIGLTTPGPAVTSAVRRLYDREGMRTTEVLGVSLNTLTRLRGGVPVFTSTLKRVHEALLAVDPEFRP